MAKPLYGRLRQTPITYRIYRKEFTLTNLEPKPQINPLLQGNILIRITTKEKVILATCSYTYSFKKVKHNGKQQKHNSDR